MVISDELVWFLLKEALGGEKLENDIQVKENMRNWVITWSTASGFLSKMFET